MHEKGGQQLAADMDTKYSTKQLYDIIERLDVYDEFANQAKERSKKKPK